MAQLGTHRRRSWAVLLLVFLAWPAYAQEAQDEGSGGGLPEPAPFAASDDAPQGAATQAEPDAAFHAELDLARDDLLLGALDEAQARLDELYPRAPEGWPKDRARLLLAQVALGQGRGVKASEWLQGLDPARFPSPAWVKWLQAQARWQAGHPEEAAPLLEQVVREAQGTRLEHLARVARADALFEAGQLAEAQALYGDILERYPEPPRPHRLGYRRGQALRSLGRDREAARAFHEVWWRYPWVEEGAQARELLRQPELAALAPKPSVAERLARAQELRRFKHWDAAEEALVELLEEVGTPEGGSAQENEVRYQQAMVSYERQDWDEAQRRWEALIQRAQTPGQGAGLDAGRLRHFLRQTHHRAGRFEEAEAMTSTDKPSRALAEFYWDSGRYEAAWTLIQRAGGLRKGEKQGWRYAWMMFKVGQYAEALRALDKVGGEIPSEQRAYWRARALDRLGRTEDAREAYDAVARQYDRTYYGFQAQNRRLELDERINAQRLSGLSPCLGEAEGQQHPDEAELAFLRLVDEDELCLGAGLPSADPGAQRAARIHWRGPDAPPSPEQGAGYAGASPLKADSQHRMSAYHEGDQPLQGAARRAWASYGEAWPLLAQAAFLYDIGLDEPARQAIREAGLEFEGLSSAFKRGRPSAARPIALPHKRWDHYVDHRGSQARGFWGLKPDGALFPVPKAAPERQAVATKQQALYDHRKELRGALRLAMMEIGDHHFVRRMRLGEGGWSRKAPKDARAMWSEAYPRAFPHYVQRYAAQEGVNPYLLWALMTVESGYNPDSVSHANARGLLQVIPKTGGKVAEELGDGGFGPYDLMDPQTSVRHGAWYFARLVEKFGGQEPLAIASYNGGPHNLQRWLIHKEAVPLDEFIEEIPFDEARRYVKRVLRYLGVFLEIYEDQDRLYLGQRLSADILRDPRY